MCDVCVMNRVKRKMLNRRDFFRTSAGAGAAAALGATLAPRPALAQEGGGMVDMTHTLTEDFPTFFGEQQFFLERAADFAEDGFNAFEMRVHEHTGTHVDAPLHFSEDGNSVAEIPIDRLIVPLAVIDIREKAEADPDAQLTPDDIAEWIERNGDLPRGACVAMNSGWARHVGGTMFRNADDDGVMHFPGFHPEAAEMLLEADDIAGIAVDTLSLDHGPSADFAVHYGWLPAGRWGIECLAGLDEVPDSGAVLVVGAPKHAGGTGGPARVFTLL